MVRLQNSMLVAVLGVGLVALMTCDAMAQRRGGGRRGFGRGGVFQTSRVQLATAPEVQADLKFADEQKEAVATLNDDMREERRSMFQGGGGGGDFAAMRERMEKLEADMNAKLAEKLDDAQNKRLTEIYVRVNGTNSLSDKDVQAKLAITKEQNDKLADAREENVEEMRDAFQDFQDMSREERQQATQELREEADGRLLAVLTDEQKSQFEALKGAEIEIDMSQFRRGFGGRGGGRGGFGGGRGGGRDGNRNADRPERPE